MLEIISTHHATKTQLINTCSHYYALDRFLIIILNTNFTLMDDACLKGADSQSDSTCYYNIRCFVAIWGAFKCNSNLEIYPWLPGRHYLFAT